MEVRHYVRVNQPYDMSYPDIEDLWSRITCPTLLVYGKESWAPTRRRMGASSTSRPRRSSSSSALVTGLQHDRLDDFVATTREFIK